MTPNGAIEFNPHHKTGFQARYLDPTIRRFYLDRLEQSFQQPNNAEERSPPEQSGTEPNTRKLEELAEKTHEPLLKIRTGIPFNPFPDDVIIDFNKVNIIYREFFWSSHTHSVLIKDISDIIVETGPIFATLKIIDVGFTENSVDVRYLRKKDAIKAREIIQGLVVAHKYGVDLAKVNPHELYDKVMELGRVEEKT